MGWVLFILSTLKKFQRLDHRDALQYFSMQRPSLFVIPTNILCKIQTAIETQLKDIPWPLGSEFDIDRICKKYMTFVLRWETKIKNNILQDVSSTVGLL